MDNHTDMHLRLYTLLNSLVKRGFKLITAGIDYTDSEGTLHIKWQRGGLGYQLVLIATSGLDGFSVYRVYGDEELSEDEVLFEFEHDSDIDKV